LFSHPDYQQWHAAAETFLITGLSRKKIKELMKSTHTCHYPRITIWLKELSAAQEAI
jgi:hypothetical protein